MGIVGSIAVAAPDSFVVAALADSGPVVGPAVELVAANFLEGTDSIAAYSGDYVGRKASGTT